MFLSCFCLTTDGLLKKWVSLFLWAADRRDSAHCHKHDGVTVQRSNHMWPAQESELRCEFSRLGFHRRGSFVRFILDQHDIKNVLDKMLNKCICTVWAEYSHPMCWCLEKVIFSNLSKRLVNFFAAFIQPSSRGDLQIKHLHRLHQTDWRACRDFLSTD